MRIKDQILQSKTYLSEKDFIQIIYMYKLKQNKENAKKDGVIVLPPKQYYPKKYALGV